MVSLNLLRYTTHHQILRQNPNFELILFKVHKFYAVVIVQNRCVINVSDLFTICYLMNQVLLSNQRLRVTP